MADSKKLPYKRIVTPHIEYKLPIKDCYGNEISAEFHFNDDGTTQLITMLRDGDVEFKSAKDLDDLIETLQAIRADANFPPPKPKAPRKPRVKKAAK
jgi:hypothetical protein